MKDSNVRELVEGMWGWAASAVHQRRSRAETYGPQTSVIL